MYISILNNIRFEKISGLIWTKGAFWLFWWIFRGTLCFSREENLTQNYILWRFKIHKHTSSQWRLFFHPAKFDNFKDKKITDYKIVSVAQSKNLQDWKLPGLTNYEQLLRTVFFMFLGAKSFLKHFSVRTKKMPKLS